ncbi:MAG: hypothetical protein LBV21_00905 [Candidatus Adiutrix sp.]|jgi:hypothetical protein|nr:hypothetical protein [Candidatus Adiutrix sp.]
MTKIPSRPGLHLAALILAGLALSGCGWTARDVGGFLVDFLEVVGSFGEESPPEDPFERTAWQDEKDREEARKKLQAENQARFEAQKREWEEQARERERLRDAPIMTYLCSTNPEARFCKH